ncbi:MAG: hypothetical protein K2L94_03515 [Alphaproteobacteria bacterium]|nr:hypothetical protein [Alphaproteobacteria bacterium]
MNAPRSTNSRQDKHPRSRGVTIDTQAPTVPSESAGRAPEIRPPFIGGLIYAGQSAKR